MAGPDGCLPITISRFPGLGLTILASDIAAHRLARAEQACYPASALKDLPRPLKGAAFEREDASGLADRTQDTLELGRDLPG